MKYEYKNIRICLFCILYIVGTNIIDTDLKDGKKMGMNIEIENNLMYVFVNIINIIYIKFELIVYGKQ